MEERRILVLLEVGHLASPAWHLSSWFSGLRPWVLGLIYMTGFPAAQLVAALFWHISASVTTRANSDSKPLLTYLDILLVVCLENAD